MEIDRAFHHDTENAHGYQNGRHDIEFLKDPSSDELHDEQDKPGEGERDRYCHREEPAGEG